MLTREIPSSGEAIGVIGLGTYRSFDERLSGSNRARLTEVLERFFAGDGTVIDSSPMYGRAEATVGELLKGMNGHDRAWITTKVWTRGRDAGIAEMERSMDLLGVASMPLMQVHNLVDCDTHLETLRGWKADGRIRYIGITHYTASAFDELAGYLRAGGIDFVQFPYSIRNRAAESGFLDLCADLGVATLINRPLEQGALPGRMRGALPDFAAELGCASWGALLLKYLLGDPAVTCVIPATGNPEHMTDNLAAGEGPLPDAAMRRRMAAWFDGG